MAYCPGCPELRALRLRNKELAADNARLAGQNTTMGARMHRLTEEARMVRRARPCYAERCRWRVREDGVILGEVHEVPQLAEGD